MTFTSHQIAQIHPAENNLDQKKWATSFISHIWWRQAKEKLFVS